MKKISILAAILSLGIAAFSAPAFSAEQQSQYKVESKVPDYINSSISKIVPVKIKITTPDGKPYNGKVIMGTAGFGTIVGTKPASDFVDQDVVDGEVNIKAELDGGTRLLIGIYKTRQEPIGTVEAPVHHIASCDFLPEQSKLCVPADGKSRPVVYGIVKDEAGNPVEGVVVRTTQCIQTSPSASTTKQAYATTDSNGIIKFVYPPNPVHMYVKAQLIVPDRDQTHTVTNSGSLFLYFRDSKKPKMVSLKNAVERLEGATCTWDSTNRTMTVKGVGSFGGDVAFKEGTQFIIEDSLIKGIASPITRKGDDLLVSEGSENWIY